MKLYKILSKLFSIFSWSLLSIVVTFIVADILNNCLENEYIGIVAAIISIIWIALIVYVQMKKYSYRNLKFSERLYLKTMEVQGNEKVPYIINEINSCDEYIYDGIDYKCASIVAEYKSDIELTRIFGMLGVLISLALKILDFEEDVGMMAIFVITISTVVFIILSMRIVKEKSYIASVLENFSDNERKMNKNEEE